MLSKVVKVNLLFLILLLLHGSMLGCGQKGDLYLPEEDKHSESDQE